MYNYIQRGEIARRIARPAHIPTYRRLLGAAGHPMATKVDTDESRLAVSLVSLLLESMTEAEVLHATESPAQAKREPITETVSAPAAMTVKKRSKTEEYPLIHWQDMDSPLIRTADSIFTDSVNLGRWLRETEKGLYEKEAPAAVVAEYVEKAIRLELCHSELRSFEKTGEFMGKHPFIAQRSERDRAMDLLKENPVEFTREMHRIEMNISRYSSHLNSKKLSEEKKKLAQANLEKFRAALAMYEEILKTVING